MKKSELTADEREFLKMFHASSTERQRLVLDLCALSSSDPGFVAAYEALPNMPERNVPSKADVEALIVERRKRVCL